MKQPEIDSIHSIFSRPVLLVFLCLVVGNLFVYLQVHNFQFVSYDDNLYVEENPVVQQGLTWQGVCWAFTDATQITHFWAPLTWLSMLVDYQIYGRNAGGYHVTNLVVHILSCLLLFLVLYRMTDRLPKSAFVALLFAVHPLHVESVAWVTERKDVLSGFFWLLTMLAYHRYCRRPSFFCYLLTLLWFCMGLMAKPMLVTLPFALLLLDYWPLCRIRYHSFRQFCVDALPLVKEKVIFFILIALVSFAAFLTQDKGGVLPSTAEFPLLLRAQNVVVAYCWYLWKTVWPFHLAVAYPYPYSLPLAQVVGSLVILLTITLFSIASVRKRPWFAVGWFWYLGTLVPVIGIVVIASQAVADRYAYIPHIGVFIIMVWGFSELFERSGIKKNIVLTAAFLFLILTAMIAEHQAGVWQNSETLFRQTLAVSDNSAIACNGLGDALKEKGQSDQALTWFLRAVQIDPRMSLSYNNIGTILEQKGELEAAKQFYQKAIQLEPGFAEAHNNLGVLLYKQDHVDGAIAQIRKALQIKPENSEFQHNIRLLDEKKQRIQQAIVSLQQKIHVASTDLHLSYYYIGVLYGKLGERDQAIHNFRQALSEKPDFEKPRLQLADLYRQTGKFDAAIDLFQYLIEHHPGANRYYYEMAALYAGQGQLEQAYTWLVTAVVKGYTDMNRIRTNPVFETLWQDPHYRDLLNRLMKAKASVDN